MKRYFHQPNVKGSRAAAFSLSHRHVDISELLRAESGCLCLGMIDLEGKEYIPAGASDIVYFNQPNSNLFTGSARWSGAKWAYTIVVWMSEWPRRKSVMQRSKAMPRIRIAVIDS